MHVILILLLVNLYYDLIAITNLLYLIISNYSQNKQFNKLCLVYFLSQNLAQKAGVRICPPRVVYNNNIS